MITKKIKFLNLHQNLLLFLFFISIFLILNIYIGKYINKENLKGAKGIFVVLTNIEYVSPILEQKFDPVVAKIIDRTFYLTSELIENRATLLSLKNCNFSKVSDLVTKINLEVRKNISEIVIKYEIRPVKNMMKCQESIYDLFLRNIKLYINKEILKLNNELPGITLKKNIIKSIDTNKIQFSFEKILINEKISELENLEKKIKNIISALSNDDNLIRRQSFIKTNKYTNNYRQIVNTVFILLFAFVYAFILLLKNKKII